jgi:hypothetical protein
VGAGFAPRTQTWIGEILKASAGREIEEAFTMLVRERADALFVALDSLFESRRVQLATPAARQPLAFSGSRATS